MTKIKKAGFMLLISGSYAFVASHPFSLTGANIALVISLIGLILQGSSWKGKRSLLTAYAILGYNLALVIFSFFSPDFRQSLKGICANLWNWLIPLTVASFIPRHFYNRLLGILTMGYCLTVVLGLLALLTPIGWPKSVLWAGKRFKGFHGYPTIYAMTIAVLIGFSIGNWWRKNWKKRWWEILPLLILNLGIGLASSKGPFVALILVALGFFFSAKYPFQRLKSICIMVVVLAPLSIPYMRERTLLAPKASPSSALWKDKYESIVKRVNIWKAYLSVFFRHPMVGIGYNTWKENLEIKKALVQLKVLSTSERKDFHAHNSFIHTITETGIIGGSIFLGLWIIILWQTWLKWKKEGHGEAFIMTGVLLICSMFDHPFGHGYGAVVIPSLFFFLLGLGLS